MRLFRRRARRANVSVELALVSTFILLPLMAGSADYFCILTATAQTNTALQALMYYAWTNESAAQSSATQGTLGNEQTLITAINNASAFQISATPALEYECITTSGNYPVSSMAPYTQGASCPSGETLQKLVQYTVTTTAGLPFPLVKPLSNPYTITAVGSAVL